MPSLEGTDLELELVQAVEPGGWPPQPEPVRAIAGVVSPRVELKIDERPERLELPVPSEPRVCLGIAHQCCGRGGSRYCVRLGWVAFSRSTRAGRRGGLGESRAWSGSLTKSFSSHNAVSFSAVFPEGKVSTGLHHN